MKQGAHHHPLRLVVYWLSVVLLIWLGLQPIRVFGQNVSLDEIIHRTNLMAYYQGKSGRAQVHMTIEDGQGRSRQRRFTILRLDQQDSDDLDNQAYRSDQYYYVYFQRPADVNKMAFLVWKHLDADDDRWLYLPALDLVKRISASDKRTSFVGSDYFYEDISGRALKADDHLLVETSDQYYVLKHTPKDPQSVEFSHYIMYVHKDSFLPIQITYFDKQGKKYRVATALTVDTIDGFPTVTQSTMEDLRAGTKTTMRYTKVEYNLPFAQDVFSERYLRRPPRKWLR